MSLTCLVRSASAQVNIPMGNIPMGNIPMVLMHGLGSDEQDMYGLASMLHPAVEVYCLRAPYRYGPGYAWFDIQWTPHGIEYRTDELKTSLELVAGFCQPLGPNLIVGGFSQGAMMTIGMMSQYSGLFAHAVLLSGRNALPIDPNFRGEVFHAHGSFDDVIPIESAWQLKSELKHLGDRYTYHEYDMGHGVSEQEIDDLNHWIETRICGTLTEA